MEKSFVFDPSKGIDIADIAALKQRFSQKRQQLEAALLAGAVRLSNARNEALHQRQQLQSSLRIAALEVAQAEADLQILG